MISSRILFPGVALLAVAVSVGALAANGADATDPKSLRPPTVHVTPGAPGGSVTASSTKTVTEDPADACAEVTRHLDLIARTQARLDAALDDVEREAARPDRSDLGSGVAVDLDRPATDLDEAVQLNDARNGCYFSTRCAVAEAQLDDVMADQSHQRESTRAVVMTLEHFALFAPANRMERIRVNSAQAHAVAERISLGAASLAAAFAACTTQPRG